MPDVGARYEDYSCRHKDYLGKWMHDCLVYVADLYKAETTIPAAFEAVKKDAKSPEAHVREICRKYFHNAKIMQRIANDLGKLFEDIDNEQLEAKNTGDLWDDDMGTVDGGVNYADEVDVDGSIGD